MNINHECYRLMDWIKMLVEKLRSPENVFVVENVTVNNNVAISNFYVNRTWDSEIQDDDILRIRFKFKNTSYIIQYPHSNPLRFPPYSYATMSSDRTNRRIAFASCDGVNVTEIIKMYAGPLQNFYSDLNAKYTLRDFPEFQHCDENSVCTIIFHDGGSGLFRLDDILA